MTASQGSSDPHAAQILPDQERSLDGHQAPVPTAAGDPPGQAASPCDGTDPADPDPAAPTALSSGTAGRPRDLIRQYELVEMVKAYDPDADEALLNKAYVFALKAHADQTRSSGDPYFSHPLAVAGILTQLRLDTASIATGLLHDVVEDTDTSISDIQEHFGLEVARLVDGVTKISKRELAPDTDGKAENFAKFLLATAVDLRVLLVKLADRLHNMRTLHFVKPEKRERIARETMEIYAPMAARIGIQGVKEELEDLSFKHLNPSAYENITEGLAAMGERAVSDVVALSQRLREAFDKASLQCEVYSREKRPFSVWRKMQRKRNTLSELADIYAFRVITETTEDCYRALGIIHRLYPMIPGEFDDYISTPKPNGYRSIHTAVVATEGDREGQRVEVQIRSKEMHEIAERGVAAHWKYKEASNRSDGTGSVVLARNSEDPYHWMRGMLQTLVSEDSKSAALEQAKIDLYQDQVFPFTPRGRVIPLPAGSTALDFAYAIHTEVGDRFSGAKINGVSRPRRTPLKNGDVVEVLKSEAAPIPADWETFVVTGAARSGVRRRIRALKQAEQITLGRKIATSAFAARDLPFTEKAMDAAASKLGFDNRDELFEAAGRLDITSRAILEAVYPNLDEDSAGEGGGPVIKFGEKIPRRTISLAGVTPGGAVRLGSCCRPLPGERIVGVRDIAEKAIMVHRLDCDQLAFEQGDEWLSLSWTDNFDEQFVTPIVITVNNKTGALGHIGTMLARYGADIVDLTLQQRAVDFYDLRFDILVRDARHLSSVLTGLRASDYVVSADRVDEDEKKGP